MFHAKIVTQVGKKSIEYQSCIVTVLVAMHVQERTHFFSFRLTGSTKHGVALLPTSHSKLPLKKKTVSVVMGIHYNYDSPKIAIPKLKINSNGVQQRS